MGLPKQLSEQQKKFAELLVYNEGRKTPTECALEAGYAEGSAHVRASELRNANKYPLVVKYIGELREEIPMILKNDMVIQFHEERLIDLESKQNGVH